jgi:hypothetical protein
LVVRRDHDVGAVLLDQNQLHNLSVWACCRSVFVTLSHCYA